MDSHCGCLARHFVTHKKLLKLVYLWMFSCGNYIKIYKLVLKTTCGLSQSGPSSSVHCRCRYRTRNDDFLELLLLCKRTEAICKVKTHFFGVLGGIRQLKQILLLVNYSIPLLFVGHQSSVTTSCHYHKPKNILCHWPIMIGSQFTKPCFAGCFFFT